MIQIWYDCPAMVACRPVCNSISVYQHTESVVQVTEAQQYATHLLVCVQATINEGLSYNALANLLCI